MNEHVFSTGRPAEAAMASALVWPPVAEKFAKHKRVRGELKPLRDLPLFCNPLVIFVGNWLLMMGSLSFQVTYVSYPHMGMPMLLFGISLGSFLFGYVASRMLLHRWATPSSVLSYSLDVTQLWQMNLILCGGALMIIVFNWFLAGAPPAVGDPSSYLTYGRFKQVLFPLLVTIAVNAILDPARWRKALFISFGVAGMILYITRGLLMVALLQMFFVYSLKTGMSRRKLYTILADFVA